MATIRVEVTAEDIAHGIVGDACGCPIALAAARAGIENPSMWPEEDGDESGRLFWGHYIPGKARPRANVPQVANDFACRFDNGWHVEPFTFDLDLPATQEEHPHGDR